MKREPTLIYSILIEDRAVIPLEAGASEARGLCKEEWFLEDLSRLRSNGEPVFRPGLRVRARPATEEEWVKYDKACSAADDAHDIVFVCLVDLDHSSDGMKRLTER